MLPVPVLLLVAAVLGPATLLAAGLPLPLVLVQEQVRVLAPVLLLVRAAEAAPPQSRAGQAGCPGRPSTALLLVLVQLLARALLVPELPQVLVLPLVPAPVLLAWALVLRPVP